MALINCKECDHEISEKADKCPKRDAFQTPKRLGLGASIAIILFGLLFISSFVGNDNNSSSRAMPSLRIQNEHNASQKDLRQAKKFLSGFPSACDSSSFNVASDGTVNVYIKCRNTVQSTSGVIEIKNGVVRDIR